MNYKIFSFFSGAGFLDYGFESEGFDIVYVNESHKPFLDAYKHARKKLKIHEPKYKHHQISITELLTGDKNKELTEYVIDSRKDGSKVGFIGGPPCPDFSIGGKNRGRHGDNGRLSQTYIDLIVQEEPDFFLFENVKGLWKTKKHRAFYDSLKRKLRKANYRLTERLINAIEYGAPQDRERVILIGFKETATNKPDITKFDWLENATYPDRTAFDFEWIETSPYLENSKMPRPKAIPQDLTVEYWFRKNKVKTHPNAKHVFTPRNGLARFLSVQEGDVSRKSYKRLHRWRYSPTAAYGNNEVHLHPYKSRRISVAEALAIQTLPKEFELPPDMTLSNMFKTVGNGVPYLAARSLARSLKSFLEENVDETNSVGHSAGN